MKTDKVVLGILGAAAVGAALGILFAPDKGSVTRKKISSKGKDLKDSLKTNLNNLSEKANEVYSSLKGEVKEAKDDFDHEIANLKNINKSIM
ncbi:MULTISPECIES: YtxH domain-containing protein [Flavobacterium]|uniref:YtxH domain-containing protein n=1 Tax=Flavobacterium hankyongi TaxID=1176532 RepID=A0ABP8ZV58_9FLAO|nr:YtxH domain-containing protein [Flavobacterium sp. N1846]